MTKKEILNELENVRFYKRRDFLESKGFKYIGKGSSRMVFEWSKTRVLKVAYNEKGEMQNIKEADLFRFCDDCDRKLLCTLYDWNYSWQWLIQRKIKKRIYENTVWKNKKLYNKIESFGNKWDMCMPDLRRSVGKINNKFVIYDYGAANELIRKYY